MKENMKSRHFYGQTNHFKTDIPMQKKLVMMPVWMMADRQKSGKVLYTAINGRNGRIVCDTPVKWTRDVEAGGVHSDVTLENCPRAVRIML